MGVFANQPIPSANVVSPNVGAATSVISAAPCRLSSITLYCATAAVATLIAYDNASAGSGTKLATLSVPATAGSSVSLTFPDEGVLCANGITIVTTGASATASVGFKK